MDQDLLQKIVFFVFQTRVPSNEPIRVRGAALPHGQRVGDGSNHESQIPKKVFLQTRKEGRRNPDSKTRRRSNDVNDDDGCKVGTVGPGERTVPESFRR